MSIGALVGLATLLGFLATAVRFLVKHYLSELKPNGGGSMNDRLTRLEARVETILSLLQK